MGKDRNAAIVGPGRGGGRERRAKVIVQHGGDGQIEGLGGMIKSEDIFAEVRKGDAAETEFLAHTGETAMDFVKFENALDGDFGQEQAAAAALGGPLGETLCGSAKIGLLVGAGAICVGCGWLMTFGEVAGISRSRRAAISQ